VNAVIHLHPNPVLAYFGTEAVPRGQFLSDDAALVLGKPVVVLPANVNVEKDVALVPTFIEGTNCFVMPNHGVTTLGRTLSQAYHRMTTYVAEIERMTLAELLAGARGSKVNYIPQAEVEEMFALSEQIIYGERDA
jgi:L-fuculose-phosphate aldolase